ncbi:MAG TPA: pilus assembly protein PilM, partial [Patescibacteria group bacterium]|nr:pilus assembly protein PilM [Patescibacteria group bacterium]
MFGLFQKTAFGLDLSDTSIEVIQFQGTGKSMKLAAVGRMILAHGLIEDGKILDEPKVAGAIKELLAKTQPEKISTNFVVASLPESKIFTHHFKLPATIPETQLIEALRYEAEGVIPVAANELIFDYRVIVKGTEKSAQQEVLHVAVFKDIAESYARTMR